MKNSNFNLAIICMSFIFQIIAVDFAFAQKNKTKQAEPEFELVIDRTRKQELLPPQFDKTSLFFNLLKKQNEKFQKIKSNDLETQQIANILWAADGYRYLNPKIPAEDSYIEIFLVMEDGIYKWRPESKDLQDLNMEDHRKLTWQFKDAEGSTLSLVYVIDTDKFTKITGIKDYKTALEVGLKIGAISANVKLAASYEKLWAFDPILFSNDKLKSLFKLPAKGKNIIAVQNIATMQ